MLENYFPRVENLDENENILVWNQNSRQKTDGYFFFFLNYIKRCVKSFEFAFLWKSISSQFFSRKADALPELLFAMSKLKFSWHEV